MFLLSAMELNLRRLTSSLFTLCSYVKSHLATSLIQCGLQTSILSLMHLLYVFVTLWFLYTIACACQSPISVRLGASVLADDINLLLTWSLSVLVSYLQQVHRPMYTQRFRRLQLPCGTVGHHTEDRTLTTSSWSDSWKHFCSSVGWLQITAHITVYLFVP